MIRSASRSSFRVPPPSLPTTRQGGDGGSRHVFAWTALIGAPGVLDLSREVAGVGLIALVTVPVLVIWIAQRKLILADPIIVIGMMYILAAGLPAVAPELYTDTIWSRLSAQSWDTATLWTYRAWAVCSLVYWFVKSLPQRRPPPRSAGVYVHTDRLRVGVGILGLCASVAYIVMTGGQAYSHIEGYASTSTIDQIVHEMRQFAKIYIFLYFFARGRRRLFAHERWLFYGILCAYVVIFAGSASKGVALELFAMGALGYGAGGLRGNMPKKLLLSAVAVAAAYFIFLGVTAYRAEIQLSASQPAASFSEALNKQLNAAEVAFHKVATGQPIGPSDSPYDINSIFERLGLVASFAKMLDVTGGVSRYENAYETFLAPLYAILPRNMFEEKAKFFDSGEFAQMALGWTFGGFSVTLLGSLFWAWGFEGMLPAMAVLGLLLAALARRAEFDDPAGLFAKVLLAGMVLLLLNVGTTIQPIIISLVRATVFFLALNVIVHLYSPAGKTTQISRRLRP